MSNLTIITDKIRQKLVAQFATKTEIPNPYAIEKNSDVYLEDGFGILLRNANVSSRIDDFCNNYESRTFDVILVRRVFRLEVDVDNFILQSENLLEDSIIVKNIVANNDKMGLDLNLIISSTISDSGVNFVFANEFSFLYTIVSFSIDYKI